MTKFDPSYLVEKLREGEAIRYENLSNYERRRLSDALGDDSFLLSFFTLDGVVYAHLI